ncbi:hypothetical protein [Oscillatoria sp. FACHB-1406]|uniref:hypothetical protein n=1 Tax=Oscillatoria sp. FACHB-1406 TaxID=2692846 RepID=UPI0016828337|nr:hypothetical protein [Oscillatoria sp. FACHB-1406]MBD2579469.1 hypothetical protein [Oscillatoria sp. FACHB-1406]
MKKFLLKQICIWLIVFMMFISHVEPANASGDRYKKLVGEEKFTEIKEQVIHSAQDISQHKAADAYREIVNALNDFHKLRDIVKNSSRIDDVIGDVADGLDKIASTYEKIASWDEELIEYRQGYFRDLQGLSGETLRTKQELELKISGFQNSNKLIQEKLLSAVDDIEEKNLEVSLKGNESIINSLRAQTIIWDKFHSAQEQLFAKLSLNSRKVDLLLHVLEVNAGVYREAANVARLRKTAKGAMDNLRSLSDIQSIIGDLQNSWTEVDDLVSDISKAEFIIDLD